jgi:hypothetical protein
MTIEQLEKELVSERLKPMFDLMKSELDEKEYLEYLQELLKVKKSIKVIVD